MAIEFKDALNPTEQELRNWAADPEAEYPDEMPQDWDLILASHHLATSLITLASEESPNRVFFLGCLYILSGDCVRGGIREESIEKVRQLFPFVSTDAPADLSMWVKRSNYLFENPDMYEYSNWGYGDLASDQGSSIDG